MRITTTFSRVHPGEGRGPVGGHPFAIAALRHGGFPNWAAAFAGVVLVCAAIPAPPLHAEPATNTHYANVQLPNPTQEAKAGALMVTLRCVVCQGQSIADSDAPMAGDMRALVRRRIAAGASSESVRHWMVARYGAYVSYDPPLSGITWPLWLAPLLLLGIGAGIARTSFRRRR